MNKVKILLGYGSSAVLLMAVGSYVVDWGTNTLRKKQGHEYVMTAVKAMSTKWDPVELDIRAHLVLIEGLHKNNQTTSNYFRILSQLGALRTHECLLMSMATVTYPTRYISAGYTCKLFYENSPATFTMEIRQQDLTDDWKIATLNVDAPIFSQNNAQSN